MSRYGYEEQTLDKPEAQAFIRDLIELCNRHRVRLSGNCGYPLVIERMPDGASITGLDTEGIFFNSDPPVHFDLEVAEEEGETRPKEKSPGANRG